MSLHDANWTINNQRPIAKEDLVLITGIITGDGFETVSKRYPIPVPAQQETTSDSGSVVKGHCYCGKVQLGLPRRLEPTISVICHCHDCREWHSVGTVPYMMFPLDFEEDGSPRIPLKVQLLLPTVSAFTERITERHGLDR